MNSFISKLLLLTTLFHSILAFAPRPQGYSLTAHHNFVTSQRHVSTLARFNSKQNEIEALEEKLRKLKEETDESSKEVAALIYRWCDSAPTAIDTVDEPFEEMLSESWKDLTWMDVKYIWRQWRGGVVKNLIGAAIHSCCRCNQSL